MKVDSSFVFLDRMDRPFKVQMWGEDAWVFYWNEGSQNWVSLRKLDPVDLPYFEQSKLPPEQAALYD